MDANKIIIETTKEFYKNRLEKIIENDDDLLDKVKYLKDTEGNILKIIITD